jgi:hypothetical protein
MENELGNMTKQQLIEQLLLLKKSNLELESSNQKLESSNQKLESSNQYQALIIANLQRMLFGSKKERFISENKNQLIMLFEEFASQEYLEDETPVKEKITYEVKNQTLYIDFSKLQDEEFNGRTVIHCPSLAGLRVGGQNGPKNDESTTYKTVIMSGFAQDTMDINIKDYVMLELERNTIKYLKVASENKYVNQTNVELKPGNNISVADIALSNHNNLVLHTYVPELHLQMHDSATMYISGQVQKRMMHL